MNRKNVWGECMLLLSVMMFNNGLIIYCGKFMLMWYWESFFKCRRLLMLVVVGGW